MRRRGGDQRRHAGGPTPAGSLTPPSVRAGAEAIAPLPSGVRLP